MQTLYQCTIAFILIVLYLDFLNAAVSFIEKKNWMWKMRRIVFILLLIFFFFVYIFQMTMKQIEQSMAMFRKSCSEKTGVQQSKCSVLILSLALTFSRSFFCVNFSMLIIFHGFANRSHRWIASWWISRAWKRIKGSGTWKKLQNYWHFDSHFVSFFLFFLLLCMLLLDSVLPCVLLRLRELYVSTEPKSIWFLLF